MFALQLELIAFFSKMYRKKLNLCWYCYGNHYVFYAKIDP